MASEPDRTESPLADLADYLQDPENAKRRLPYVVGLLDADDDRIRLAAAWTCCMAAVEQPEVVDYLVRRLTDRLDNEEVTLEVTQALDYIAARYPETVEEVVGEIQEAEDDRSDIPFPEVGNFTRSHYYGYEPDRTGVGRTRVAGGGEDDPRVAYGGPEEDHDPEADEDRPEEEGEGGEGSEEGEATADEEAAEADEEGADEDGAEPATGGASIVRRTTDVASIAARSRFTKLHILASRDEDRYGEIYEALVGGGGEEVAVALRMVHQPESGDAADFAAGVGAELERWSDVDAHPHVVGLLDWGSRPHPWLVTLISGASLADKGRPGPDRALGDARKLADAVSHLHQSDVVHGALDPGNVAYPDDVIASTAREAPLLDNVGLVHTFRHHFDPAAVLDPRYAAPEYYDRGHGRVDHATDIYGLGALIFRLLTGRPPYTGDFEAVRAGVLEADPPVPSDHVDVDLPGTVDEVVEKAMAKQKLRRYETVEHLRQELRGVGNGGG